MGRPKKSLKTEGGDSASQAPVGRIKIAQALDSLLEKTDHRRGIMKDTNPFFAAHDGTRIEIATHNARNPKALILVWPCFGGNALAYDVPYESLLNQGFSIILYNPRGHGQSEGQMSVSAAVDDLTAFLEDFNHKQLPIIGVGHSVGGSGLLKLGSKVGCIEKFFLIAPGLDSRESLFHMYETGAIQNFIQIMAGLTHEKALVYSVMADKEWMDRDYWEENSLKDRLDALPGRLMIGTLLQDLFIPGVVAFSELEEHREKVQILMPTSDDWYPMETTLRFAREYGIPITTINAARDHLFSDARVQAWDYIENLLFK